MTFEEKAKLAQTIWNMHPSQTALRQVFRDSEGQAFFYLLKNNVPLTEENFKNWRKWYR